MDMNKDHKGFMKAAIRRNYSPPKGISIESMAIPKPKENEVLVKVHTTTVNRTDCANLTAKPFIMRFVLGFSKPRQIVLGTDFAGEIIECGSNVSNYALGDRVFGFIDTGIASQAEYVLISEKNIFRIPDEIDFKSAAASLEGAHYAYTFIHKTNIQSGQKIFINGATGAIGSALLQFVKQYDVKIAATADTENIELIKSLGADNVYDYTQIDFTVEKEKFDFIFDAVGKSTFGKCQHMLTEKGIYISSELGPFAQNVFYPLFNSFKKQKVIFPVPFNYNKTIPYIQEALKKGVFKPVIDRVYVLNDISEAYEYVLSGKKTGNVLVSMSN